MYLAIITWKLFFGYKNEKSLRTGDLWKTQGTNDILAWQIDLIDDWENKFNLVSLDMLSLLAMVFVILIIGEILLEYKIVLFYFIDERTDLKKGIIHHWVRGGINNWEVIIQIYDWERYFFIYRCFEAVGR